MSVDTVDMEEGSLSLSDKTRPAPPLRHTLLTWQGMVSSILPIHRDFDIKDEDINDMEKICIPPRFLELVGKIDQLEEEMVASLIQEMQMFVTRNQMPVFETNEESGVTGSSNRESLSWSALHRSFFLSNHILRIRGNVYACTRKNVTIETLKAIIKKRERYDIEQVAGLIVSFLGPEKGSQLIPYLRHIIFTAAMWIEKTNTRPARESYDDLLQRLLVRLQEKIMNLMTKRYGNLNIDIQPTDPHAFLNHLHRIRRNRPKDLTAALRIPATVYNTCGVDKDGVVPAFQIPDGTPEFVNWWRNSALPEDPIILSKRHFRFVSRWLNRSQEPTDASSILRREIDRLEKSPTTMTGDNPVLSTKDPLALAFAFMQLQRRLQLKVVSDLEWTRFLASGEGNEIWQNDWARLTSFELKLLEMATSRPQEEIDFKCLSAISLPPGIKDPNNTESTIEKVEDKQSLLARIGKCCLLMEAYVTIHGEGNMESLNYKKGEKTEPRGPVDQYNNLCTILYSEKQKLLSNYAAIITEDDLPPPCHKFLAKDIMSWNNSFKEDAFADGKIPGWFTWLRAQRDAGSNYPPLQFTTTN